MSLHTVEALLATENVSGKVKNTPPFIEFLEKSLSSAALQQAIKLSHRMDPNYYSWQAVRFGGVHIGSTAVTCGTGVEGYLAYSVNSGEELSQEILRMGLEIWRGIRLLHKNSWTSRNKLEKFIQEDSYSKEAFEEWYAIFGALIARQKASILNNQKARELQSRTKELVKSIPPIVYKKTPSGLLVQEYSLPSAVTRKQPLTLTGLTDEEQLAWNTMLKIGQFGHPIVRAGVSLR